MVGMTKNAGSSGGMGRTMADKVPKQRDLDHLMEQNDTELTFLSAYGGTTLEGDGAPLMAALKRFLKAGNVVVKASKVDGISFGFGTATVVEHGCKVVFKGAHLPIVPSDLQQAGFAHGLLIDDRSRCEVVLIEWGYEQRRFIERISEHVSLDG